jgi:hypothetical protein
MDSSLRPAAGYLLRRTIEMLFLDGDPRRPACFEHYDPELGTPSLFRGIDDYVHSWIADLIVRYAAGLSVSLNGELRLAPLPLSLRQISLHGLLIRGHEVTVAWKLADDKYVGDLQIDGKSREIRLPIGECLKVSL